MSAYLNANQELNSSKAIANVESMDEVQFNLESRFADNRPMAIQQRKLHDIANNSNPQQLKALNTPVIQRDKGKYEKLKKVGGPEMDHHKEMGKKIVATYRILESVDVHLKKGKNKEAIKAASLGLVKAGISIATMAIGAPGAGEAIIAGEIGTDTIISEGLSKGGGLGVTAVTSEESPLDSGHASASTTTGGVIKSKVGDAVGTPGKALKTLAGFIPFYSAGKMIYAGAKMASTSRDDWNREKGIIIGHVTQTLALMDEIIAELNMENYGDTEIVTANKTMFMRHKRRSLTEVVAKYKSKTDKLKTTIDGFKDKHGDVMPLIGGSSASSDEF